MFVDFMRCCQCLNFISTITGDMLDEPTAIVEGYNSYFSFSKKRSGYSGKIEEVLHVFSEVLLKKIICLLKSFIHVLPEITS